MKFFVEQVALCPSDPARAIAFLNAIGLDEWVHDHVEAIGRVYGNAGAENEADLSFNYQATGGVLANDACGVDVTRGGAHGVKPLELEVLHYTNGLNWMMAHKPRVSHLGMHCTEDELDLWREVMRAQNIRVAQEVMTHSHTNPAITGKRRYIYVIFDTYEILSVDLKFIVRKDVQS